MHPPFYRGKQVSAVKDQKYANPRSIKGSQGPLAHYSIAHEDLRRSVTNGLAEFYYSISSKLGKLKQAQTPVDQILESLSEQYR